MAGEAKNVRGEGEAGEGGRNLARLPNPGYVVERAATANDGPIRVKQPLDKLVSVDVADVDLLLGFSNGEFVIIPNGALDAVDGKTHATQFTDRQTTLSDLFLKVGTSFAAKPGSLRLVSERIDAAPPPEEGGRGEPAPLEEDYSFVPPAPLQKVSAGPGPGPGKGKGDGIGDYTEAPAIAPAFTPEPPVYRRGTLEPNLEMVTGKATGLPSLASSLFTASEFKLDPHPSGLPSGAYRPMASGEDFKLYAADLAVRASPEKQAFIERIDGTDVGDNIKFNTPFSTDESQWSKTLHLTINNMTSVSSISLELPGSLPTGFDIKGIGATVSRSGNIWNITPTPAMLEEGVNLQLVYKIDSVNQGEFQAQVKVEGMYGTLPVTLGEVLDFTWRDAVGTDGFSVTNAVGKPYMVLPRQGVGVEIYAGKGNDTIHAGAGPDLIYGEDGDDQIYGGTGDDTLFGGAGNDTLDGEQGINTASYDGAPSGVKVNISSTDRSDFLINAHRATGWGNDELANIQNVIGSAGNDTLIGDSNPNRLEGSDGNDWIEGGAGVDTLLGGLGDDTLLGGEGADVLDGGDGNDTASYGSAGAAVAVSLTTGRGTAGDAAGDTLANIENLIGSGYNDTLTGNAAANSITGGAGNDSLTGMGGGDTLDGGTGTDTVSYAWVVSSDNITGVNVDLANIMSANATLPDAYGNDSLTGIENLVGSRYNDTLRGDASANRLEGGQGNDILEGGAGADALIGGEGRDTASYEHAASGVVVSLTNSLVTATGDAAGDTFDSIEDLIGTAHADQLIGNSANNSIVGGAGNDTLEGLGGADTLVGGTGTNTASYEHADGSVRVSMVDAASATEAARLNNTGHARGDYFQSIQNLIGSDYADTLIGDAQANRIAGGAGDDVLDGGAGADTLDGGTGNNTASYASAGAAVRVSMKDAASATPEDRQNNTGDAQGDYFIDIHNLTGSGYNDTLLGDDTATRSFGSRIDGGGGNDTITGYATKNGTNPVVSDTLVGGAGNDRLMVILQKDVTLADLRISPVSVEGGAGNDTLVLNRQRTSGVDYYQVDMTQGLAYYDWSTANTVVNFDPNGIENFEVAGANLRVYVTPNAVSNYIKGGADWDYVAYSPLTTAITLTTNEAAGLIPYQYIVTGSGTGTDTLEGIEAIYYGSRAADTMTGGTQNDFFHGYQGNDSILGAGGNDTLHGGDGNDTVYGGVGNDTISGGWGNDTLYGGVDANDYSGNDTLAFRDFCPVSDPVFVNISKNAVTAVFSSASRTVEGETSYGVQHGTDRVYGFKNIVASDAADYLYGNDHANNIEGRGGDDVLVGGLGNDTLDGGAGSDTASWVYMATASSVSGENSYGVMVNLSGSAVSNANFSGGGATNSAWAGAFDVDTLTSIENITGSSYRDYLIGNATGSVIDGGGGRDTLVGGAGADSFIVNIHNTPDSISGGSGTDTITLKGLAGSYDLLTLRTGTTISSVETIDLRSDGQATAFTLNRADILGLTGSTSITILADKQAGGFAGDTLTLAVGDTINTPFDPMTGGSYTITNSGLTHTIVWQVA